jgi:hypothetical protein
MGYFLGGRDEEGIGKESGRGSCRREDVIISGKEGSWGIGRKIGLESARGIEISLNSSFSIAATVKVFIID